VTKNNSAALSSEGEAQTDTDEPDTFVPDPQVWAEFGITSMTGHRWTHDPDLGFPPPIKIRTRCFRSRKALEVFKKKMIRKAVSERKTAS
jgi:hypothetical protein